MRKKTSWPGFRQRFEIAECLYGRTAYNGTFQSSGFSCRLGMAIMSLWAGGWNCSFLATFVIYPVFGFWNWCQESVQVEAKSMAAFTKVKVMFTVWIEFSLRFMIRVLNISLCSRMCALGRPVFSIREAGQVCVFHGPGVLESPGQ